MKMGIEDKVNGTEFLNRDDFDKKYSSDGKDKYSLAVFMGSIFYVKDNDIFAYQCSQQGCTKIVLLPEIINKEDINKVPKEGLRYCSIHKEL